MTIRDIRVDPGPSISRMLGQWAVELNHVAAIVGGFSAQQKHIGQQGVRFTPISRDRQANAVRFLTTDRATRLHIEDVRSQIARALDPSVQEAAAGARATTDDLFDPAIAPDLCWIDYSIGR